MSYIEIEQATEHNLKNISLKIPRNQFIAVIGPSGSGKSSLIYDCLHKESQRRYLQSFSEFSSFLLDKVLPPKVKNIKGLSPTISVDQKTTTLWPRMTIGTMSEIQDFLRILFAKCATYYCSQCDIPMHGGNIEDFLSQLQDEAYEIYSPIIFSKQGKLDLSGYLKQGFSKAILNGEYVNLEDIETNNKKKNISLFIDKGSPLNESFHNSFKFAINQSYNESCFLVNNKKQEIYFSQKSCCPKCLKSAKVLQESHFSFNSPYGSCLKCQGLGSTYSIDIEKLSSYFSTEKEFEQVFSVKILRSSKNILNQKEKEILLEKYEENILDSKKFSEEKQCSKCGGSRLSKDIEFIKFHGKSIGELLLLEIRELNEVLSHVVPINDLEKKLLYEVLHRVQTLDSIGLGYLFLNRACNTLSGGEFQRIRLCRQISEKLSKMIYILDEPTIGLHPSDHEKLIVLFKKLRDLGNTVFIIEHDQDIIYSSDYILELGPVGGKLGGYLLYEGSTNNYPRKKEYPVVKENIKQPKEWISLNNVSKNNIKNLTISIPSDIFCSITGVSGSGKSTLIHKLLVPELIKNKRNYIILDQKPLSRSERSNPLTFLKIFDEIRKIFAKLPESKKLAFTESHFSFNSQGACSSCKGSGEEDIISQYMEDIFLECSYCSGSRYRPEVLDIKFKEKSIVDVLNMTVKEALIFFQFHMKMHKALKILHDIGLDYLTLGQSAKTLSGGEAQRLKITAELLKAKSENTLYILDEPTTGLSCNDIEVLATVLESLIKNNNGLIVIEHNPELILKSDYIIDLGPEGGQNGGKILFQGSIKNFLQESTKTSTFLSACLL